MSADDKPEGKDIADVEESHAEDASSLDTSQAGTEEKSPATFRTSPASGPEVQNDRAAYIGKSAATGLIIGLVVAVGAAAFLAGAYVISSDQPDQLTQEDLDDAMAKLELRILQQQLAERQQAPQPMPQPQAQPQPQQPPPILDISADDDPTIGDPDAPITIIEFSDFQCPFCERFSSQTLPAIQQEYIDKGLVKLVYRDFPLQSIHPNAAITAAAAECADDQDGFKGMHDKLFERQSEWARANSEDIIVILTGYATDIGIDSEEFETCLATGVHVEDIRGDLEDGRAYGVSGTPGFFVGNDQVGYVSIQGAQPFDSFKRVIDMQLVSGGYLES